MRHFIAITLAFFLVVAATSAQSIPPARGINDGDQSIPSRIKDSVKGPIDAKDIAAANSLAKSLPITDWLGPMAPIAISPFFGMTVLSGLALFGPDWIADNSLLGAVGVLKNQGMFVAFLMLTVLTSLPRLSKVSKPFAQAVDQLETYSVIVILLVIKFMADFGAPDDQPVAMVQLGIFSMTADTLLSIAMVINVIVINSVKFFFEFLVWLTPVPAIDAVFEFANKGICGLLMALYAFSPTIATIVNIVMLVVAALVFQWIRRRIRFYRTMVTDPILARLWPSYGVPKTGSITVFPKSTLQPFKAKSRLALSKSDVGWELREAGWLGSETLSLDAGAKPTLHLGWMMHTIDVQVAGETQSLTFSRRYDRQMESLMDQLQLSSGSTESPKSPSHSQAVGEFA